jgi:BON domain
LKSGIFVTNGSDKAPQLVFLASKNQTTPGAVMKRASFHALVAIILMLGVFAGCSKTPARTDAQITSDVQSKFYADPAIESRQIQVQAAGGVVTLSGNVGSESERTAAASDAATVAGVRTVVNNLEVQQAAVTPPPAAAVERPRAQRKPSQRERTSKTASKPDNHQDDQGPANSVADSVVAGNTPPPTAPAVQPPPPAPLPPPPPQKVIVPAGTQLTVRLNDPLDSERNQIGDTFHGSLSAPIVIGGETVIPSGADVVGRVADVKSAGRFAGNSVLTLELTAIAMNGKTYNIQTNQWSRTGKGEGKNTATKVGIGTAAGAVLGGIIGGGKGAAIGAATGAGAGTGVAASKKGEQIKLAPEAVLNFQIINTLTVTPQSSNDRDAARMPVS